jgi:hypothetical protein
MDQLEKVIAVIKALFNIEHKGVALIRETKAKATVYIQDVENGVKRVDVGQVFDYVQDVEDGLKHIEATLQVKEAALELAAEREARRIVDIVAAFDARGKFLNAELAVLKKAKADGEAVASNLKSILGKA